MWARRNQSMVRMRPFLCAISIDQHIATFEMKTVLCFSHLRWNFVFQRPQHLMVRFANTHRVFFIEEPLPIADGEAAFLMRSVDAGSGVCVVTPHCPPASVADTETIVKCLLDALLEQENIAHPTLWYYTPMMRPLSSHIEAGLIVYDCMDELANFKFAPADLVSREDELFADADVVFTGGQSLYERKRTRHGNVHCFPSSVDATHFSKARTDPSRLQRNSGRPELGFHGVIDERMDLALIAAMADARPSWLWTFVGPVVKIDPQALPQRDNIRYTGAIAYQHLPDALSSWSAAIMPFAINEATQFISPTKTPEYLAAGLPVVSTPIRDVMSRYDVQHGVWIGATTDEFLRGCEAALSASGEEDTWRAAADALIARDSWDSTFAQMSLLMSRSAQNESPSPVAKGKSVPRDTYDYLIVGAGFAGSVLAERLARGSKRRVLLIDRREHIGGNAFDEYDDAGILVHRYGPHIFHTNSDRILEYLSQFTKWRPYEHRVLASVRNKLLPIPINRTTINELYNLQLETDEQVASFLASEAIPIKKVVTAADMILSTVGRDLYETFFQSYTCKQWGVDPSALDKAVTARVPARTNTDDRYFTDKYQCMPLHGYTRMFEKMIDHPNITVMTGVDFESVRNEGLASHTVFTGPIDEYFGFEFGPLQYRSLKFRRETLDMPRFQPVGVVNYPSADVGYTRITEYTHLTGQVSKRTSLSYEYPTAVGEPYYPVPSPENQALYQQYVQKAAGLSNVTFLGRLGTYRYYNMDQVVGQALTAYQRLEGDPLKMALTDNLQLRAYA